MTTTIEILADKPVVLIDSSYYIFFRYFATMRWFTFQKKVFNIEEITENDEFVTSFIKHMQNDMNKICKRWKTTMNNIIFCADCPRSKIWRNDLYADYKGTRTANANFNSKIFNIFNDYVVENDIVKLHCDRLEADDVVYLVQQRLKKLSTVYIITNDNDYLQLADTNVFVLNMQFKDITKRGSSDPMADLYFKTIFGDKSDNIQKISPSISKEKAQQLSTLSKKELQDWMKENSLTERFDFNLSLISFEKIPKHYVKMFNDSLAIKYI